jgi:predicted DNA-binding transcriptional regulator YafY
MPLGLAQQGPRMYLVCRFDGYDNERSLAVHRILSARASTLTFERPKDFDLKQYDDDGRFGYGDGERIRLSFRIEKAAGQHLLESPLSSDQQVVERDDSYEITATVVDSDMLERWLRGFGNAVSEVIMAPLRS